jgi:hypothetical protein
MSTVIKGLVPDIVLRHAGLVMTQVAYIASVLKEGELVCPFAVIAKGENRQSTAGLATALSTRIQSVQLRTEKRNLAGKVGHTFEFGGRGAVRRPRAR